MNENESTTVPAVKVGQIFEMSWGYDQTNVNYFQVVTLSPKGVFVREIGACSVPGTQGNMSENVRPNKDHFLNRSQWCRSGNAPTFRKIQFSRCNYGAGSRVPEPYFNFEGRYFARPVNENSSTYSSWYH